MNTYQVVTQMMDTVATESKANELLKAMMHLDDFVAGRVYRDMDKGVEVYRVQTFVERMCDDALLPEGCLNVFFLNNQRAYYQFKAA